MRLPTLERHVRINLNALTHLLSKKDDDAMKMLLIMLSFLEEDNTISIDLKTIMRLTGFKPTKARALRKRLVDWGVLEDIRINNHKLRYRLNPLYGSYILPDAHSTLP